MLLLCTLHAFPDCSELTFLEGDLDNDGVRDIHDVIVAVQILIGTIEPTDEQQCSLDLNGDSMNNICDIVFGLHPCWFIWGPCD